MHQIIDDLASDNEYFAEKFLESYGMMISNGYTESELTDGPQNGWLGHYSLSQQGIDVGDFTSYIAENSPVTFTDKKTDLGSVDTGDTLPLAVVSDFLNTLKLDRIS